jgi:hypothetical protein
VRCRVGGGVGLGNRMSCKGRGLVCGRGSQQGGEGEKVFGN